MTLERGKGFKPDQVQFGLHVRSEVARRPAMQVGAKIAARANATAPFDPDKGRTRLKSGRLGAPKSRRRRHLKGSYKVVPDGNLRVGKHSRAIARVESDVLEASTNEFGTKTQKPRRTLLRAGIAVSIEEFGRFDGRAPGGFEGGLG